MIEYIYIVKCLNCEDEHFHFFDDAKTCAMGYISDKPIITQVEVERNDFGECTDSHDLGTVWSWEDMMKDTETEAEPVVSIFTKDDLVALDPNDDPEFAVLDNSLDYEPEEDTELVAEPASDLADVPDNFKKPAGTPIVEEDQVLATNKRGDFMIPASSGYGYTVFNQNNVRIGHIDSETDEDAIRRFELGDLDEACKKRPLPEGMTIEQLVEELEANEDTVECVCCNELYPKEECHHDEKHGWICPDCKDEVVECTWCKELYDHSECRCEVDLGWLCNKCEAVIKSRGETLTFREGPLDEPCERDPLDHHDSAYNEDVAADYIADQNDRAKDANFDIESGSLQESFNPHESVEFEYDDLEITVIQGDMDPETGTYDTCERTVSYTYEQDKGDVAVDIWENFITEEDVADVPGGLEALEDETLWNKFLETHFDTLFDKYYKNLLEFYREHATSSCQDSYDSGYENFDDFYFEDVDKNTIGHSMLEELEESEDYRNRLTLCPECGTNSFGPETCICMNCGFNTLK